MSKETAYPYPVGVKLSEEQYQKIKQSGMSNTEFIRKAIDFYDGARLSSYTAIKINMIDDCIGALNVFRENVKNSDENTFNLLRENVKSVKQNGGQTFNKTPDTLNRCGENVKQIDDVKREALNKTAENVKQIEQQEEQEKQQQAWEQVKQTLRNMTTAKGRPSHEDFRRQAKKCGKTKSELERYYTKHIKFFQQDCL